MTQTDLCQNKSANSPAAPKIKLVGINSRYVHSCLALFYLRNELATHFVEAEVEILQPTINDNYYETLLRISCGEPFAVFFSAAIWNSERVEQLVRDVHGCLPHCRIVVGGPQATVLRGTLPTACCSMVIGEIEAVDPGFYRDLRSGAMQPRYTANFLRQSHRQLDFAYKAEDFTSHLNNRHIYYESSRGCPHRCTYCLSASERGLFHKDLDQVREELATILAHRPKVVRFVDRTFNDIPERALAIWRFLLAQKSETLFHFEIAPERFAEEMFTLLTRVESGRFQFEIGIQSTHHETLEAIHRPLDSRQVAMIVRRLAELNTIHLHVDLILGLPHETRESFAASFADVFAMGAHYIQMGLLKILPDTPICHTAADDGYCWCQSPPYSVYANRWLDHRAMSELYWFCECVEKFHNNRYFVSLWSWLRRQGEDIFSFFQGLLECGRQIGLFRLAATQELLCTILVEHCRARPDRLLIIDLLRYDWLRCGYRTLPDCLGFGQGDEDLAAARAYCYREWPESLAPLYGRRERNRFFKRAILLPLSQEVREFLGFAAGRGTRICILAEREPTLHGHQRAMLPVTGGESV